MKIIPMEKAYSKLNKSSKCRFVNKPFGVVQMWCLILKIEKSLTLHTIICLERMSLMNDPPGKKVS